MVKAGKVNLRVLTLEDSVYGAVLRAVDEAFEKATGEERVKLLRALGGLGKSVVIEVKYKPE